MDAILQIIGFSCISYLFVVATPMVLLKRWIGFRDEDMMEYGKVKRFFHELLYCSMCSGFWIGLVATQEPYIAAIISVGAELLHRQLN